jgi:hypothetical protein
VDAAWRVLEPRDDHLSMCIKAYNLAKTIAGRQSAMPKEIEQDHSDLYRIRHYVGRLSAWIGAARNVVSSGAQLSGILQRYCVKIVNPATPAPQVPLSLGDDFDAILNRVMPNFRDQPILSEISATVRRVAGTTALFKSDKLELKPHAEAIILDHFFTNNIQFANGDTYVACSRPSCYCCKLYFDHHPAGASTGRSHGVLWIRWRLPRLLESVEGTVDHTTLKVLRKMSEQVRKDALAALTPQKHHDFNMFDSTTGFSTSHVAS